MQRSVRTAVAVVVATPLSLVAACSSDTIIAPLTPGESLSLLERAYDRNSDVLLDRVFFNWSLDDQPHSAQEISAMSDTVRAVYDIFTAFWNPLELSLYSSGYQEPVLTPRKGLPYVLINTTIEYGVTGENSTRISDFRPRIALDRARVLYMTPGRHEVLTDFLEPSGTYAELSPRVAFLRTRLYATIQFWNVAWRFDSPPFAYRVAFEPGLEQAHVYFMITSNGYVADFNRTSSGWQMSAVRFTGIFD